MSVFVLLDCYYYDSSEVAGLFDSLEKAQAHVLATRKAEQPKPLHPDKKSLVWQHEEGRNWWVHEDRSMHCYRIEEHDVQ